MSGEWLLRLDSSLSPRPTRPATIGPIAGGRSLVVGRDPSRCDVVLDSAAFPGLISRQHATIVLEESGPVLRDSSLNGVGVDGGRTARGEAQHVPLRDGSTLVFGVRGSATEFVYRVAQRQTEADPQATAIAPEGSEEIPTLEERGESSEPGRCGGSTLGGSDDDDDNGCIGPAVASDGGAPLASAAAPAAAPEELMVEELQCCICAELLVRPCQLRCSHSFCSPCIYDWERRSRTCVICREELEEAPPQPVRLLDGLTQKLAARCLSAEEKEEWEGRAADWDGRASQARQVWGTLPPKPAPAGPPVHRHVVSRVGSGGAVSTCRRCLRPIAAGSLKLGVRSHIPLFNHTVVSWHHTSCLPLPAALLADGDRCATEADATALLDERLDGATTVLAPEERRALAAQLLADPPPARSKAAAAGRREGRQQGRREPSRNVAPRRR